MEDLVRIKQARIMNCNNVHNLFKKSLNLEFCFVKYRCAHNSVKFEDDIKAICL